MTAAGGGLALAFIAGFIGLALAPLFRFGGEFSLDGQMLATLRFTLYQASLSTLISLAFGGLLALSLARRPDLPGRVWIIRFMAAPMGLPALAGAFGVLAVWGRQGWMNDILGATGTGLQFNVYGLSGILIAHSFFNIPLAARLFYASLERLPPQYWLMAAHLGFGRVSLFRFVEWPALRRALPGAGGLVFMLCATSFTLVLTLGGGPAATTLEVAIYQALKFDFEPVRAVFLVGLQVVLAALVLAFLKLFSASEEERIESGRLRRFDGQSPIARLWDVCVIVVLILFCGAPFAAIVTSGLVASYPHLLADPLFWRALGTSFILGPVAAFVAVLLAYGLALAHYGAASRVWKGAFEAAGSLILLTPPVVLATGWFLWLKGGSGYGPYVLVALINALMSLPFAFHVLQPALRTHFERTGRLSESLGITGFDRFRVVDFAVLKRPLTTAFFFALSLSLGDLGAVALFGGDNLVTLPWLIYARLGSYRTSDAAALTLLLTLICMTFAVLGTRDSGMRGGSIR